MCLAAALLLAACAPKPGNTTKVVGQFSGDAPEVVEIVMGDILDTTVIVKNGRFEAKLPKNLTTFAVFQPGESQLQFISDGSTITINPDEGTIESSLKKGPQSRWADYNDWMADFTSEYRTKIAEFGEDEEGAEAYYEKVMVDFDKYQREAAKLNSDNIVGLLAIMQLQSMDDTEDVIALLDGLSDEVKDAIPEVAQMRAFFESKGQTAEGTSFVGSHDPDRRRLSLRGLHRRPGPGEPRSLRGQVLRLHRQGQVCPGRFLGVLVRSLRRGDAQPRERVQHLSR